MILTIAWSNAVYMLIVAFPFVFAVAAAAGAATATAVSRSLLQCIIIEKQRGKWSQPSSRSTPAACISLASSQHVDRHTHNTFA